MSKDLSQEARDYLENQIIALLNHLDIDDESLGIAREAMIEVFDAEAERIDG